MTAAAIVRAASAPAWAVPLRAVDSWDFNADGGRLSASARRRIRFHGTARPGDSLDLTLQLDATIADTAFASGEICVRGRRIADVQALTAAKRARAILALL